MKKFTIFVLVATTILAFSILGCKQPTSSDNNSGDLNDTITIYEGKIIAFNTADPDDKHESKVRYIFEKPNKYTLQGIEDDNSLVTVENSTYEIVDKDNYKNYESSHTSVYNIIKDDSTKKILILIDYFYNYEVTTNGLKLTALGENPGKEGQLSFNNYIIELVKK